MHKVLVPFDFSAISENALKYALSMFSEESHFTIYHVMDGNLSLQDPLTYTAGITRGDAVRHELEKIINEIKSELKVSATCVAEIEIGSAVESILDFAKRESFDDIIMGTRSKYDLFDKWLGTVSLGVAKRAGIPVYLIPYKAKYIGINKVVIGSDFHMESDKMLSYIANWNKDRKADLHFLHIIDEKGREDGILRNIVEEYFEKKDVSFPFTIIQEEKGNISEKILDYAEQNAAELLLIVTDKMSWFETIFTKSITQEMVLKADRPVLFLSTGLRKSNTIFLNLATI